MNPTKEQQQWLWEKCGLNTRIVHYDSGDWIEWLDDRDIFISRTAPDVDLNNLFKYAVDWNEIETIQFSHGDDGYHCWLYMKKIIGKPFYGNGLTEADALFEALYKALGGKE